MASGTIKNDRAITWGTVTNVSGYKSASNMFTCPSDGYIRITADGTLNNSVACKRDDGSTIASIKVATASQSFSETIFVRAGMRFYFTFSETTYSKAEFFALI